MITILLVSGVAFAEDSWFSSAWDWGKEKLEGFDWTSKITEKMEGIELKDVMGYAQKYGGKYFDLDDSSAFNILGKDGGLSFANFDFKFKGWDSLPSVGYKDPGTNTQFGYDGSNGVVLDATKVFGFKWDTEGGVAVTKIPGLENVKFNKDGGYSSYIQPENMPGLIKWGAESQGWVDSSGNVISQFNFGYLPGDIPFSFGSNDPAKKAEAAKKLGANLQGQKFLAGAAKNALKGSGLVADKKEDEKTMGQIEDLLGKAVKVISGESGSLSKGKMDTDTVKKIGEGVLPKLGKIDELLMGLSKGSRPLDAGDTCEGRCKKVCDKGTDKGSCPNSYKCCK
ncbi:hypothetical protein CL614_02240 [archaeon]|nr:hypothetical protein [archaeon]